MQYKFWFTTVSQYTAIDEFTRLHFLAAYKELSIYSFTDFLRIEFAVQYVWQTYKLIFGILLQIIDDSIGMW